jgi:hydroxyacylglutathione hydrolase
MVNPGYEIVTIETPALGDRSYLVHDGEVAAVIDPQRDIDRVVDVAGSRRVRIVAVAETHIHNDYVSGGLVLARITGADYLVAADESVAFQRTPVTDGQRFAVGRLTLEAVATPGHTPGHVAYVLRDGDRAVAVFSGGSMLFGSVGRTDLASREQTDDLTRAQYHSVRHLAAALPDEAEVLPTHGFGSFCAASPSGVTASNVGDQRSTNPALTESDEDRFVRELLSGLTHHPSYYAHMAPINRMGAGEVDLSPSEALDPAVLRQRIAEGEAVIDLRNRRAFAAGHIQGTLSFELADPLATYVGWTLWGRPITIVGERPEDVIEARKALSRIGIDHIAGHAVGPPARLSTLPLAAYPVADFADLADALIKDDTVVVDVRRVDEWAAGHIEGSINVPLGELPDRLDELPDGTLWVHCAAGYRASVAAGFADRAGRRVTLVDDAWAHAVALGLAGVAAPST